MMGEQERDADTAMVLDLGESSVGAFAVDVERRIVAWNAAAEAMLGYRADEVLGRRCAEVLGMSFTEHGADRHAACHNCPLASTGWNRRADTFELRVATRDSTQRWIGVGTLRARTLAGEHRVIHVFRDVTAYHALDESLERMRKPPAERETRQPGAHARYRPHAPAEPLTAREAETLRLLSHGLGTREIAEALSISRITARNHVTRVMEKLGANTRLQAVVIAAQCGLL